MRGCCKSDLRQIARAAGASSRGMAYHRDGLTKVPGWLVNLVVAVVGVGALAVLFTVGREYFAVFRGRFVYIVYIAQSEPLHWQ